MTTSAFELDLGIHQGRLASGGFELGHALAEQWVRLASGDSNALTQEADWGPLTRARVAVVPRGGTWTLTAALDGVEFVAVPISGAARELTDIALPLGGASLALTLTCDVDGTWELPSVLVEVVTVDPTTAAVVVANRSPEPGQVEVALAAAIEFDVISVSGAVVDHHQLSVYADGAKVVASGVPATGWSISLSTLPDAASLRCALTPPAQWDPFTAHTARVVYPGIDESWSFRTVDLVGPSVVAVVALDEKLVQVTFSEQVIGGTYAIALLAGAPAVTPSVVSVAMQPDGSALLTLSTEQTPGATYQLTASGVTDLLGNAIVGSTASWVGYQPDVTGRDFDLYGMLLEYDRSQDESGDLKAFVGCFQEVTNLLLTKIDRMFATVCDPDTAPEVWLDVMLSDLGNPFAIDMSLAEKRKLVQLLTAVYRQKGTDQGIINAVRLFLGLEVTIATPWRTGWRVGIDRLAGATSGTDVGTTRLASGLQRDLYSYNIVSPIALTVEQRKRIRQIATYMQRLVCHMRAIVEPAPAPALPDHWQLGLSRVGVNTLAHA